MVSPTPYVRHQGIAAALPRRDVDTDQIVPKQFLTGVARTGFGRSLFFDWRYAPDGTPNPAFELNAATAQGATILIAGPNFGCGSSREHAVWALAEYGFRAIIAPSFGDIFVANCCRNGVLPVRLAEGQVDVLTRRAQRATVERRYQIVVDLADLALSDDQGFSARFTFDAYRRELLLRGLDEIGRTLLEEPRIAEYERMHA